MDFPKPKNSFLKAADFHDNKTTLTYVKWERKSNDDRTDKDGKVVKKWQDCLDFNVKYSFPEFPKDKAGEPMKGKNGEAMRNSNYRPEFPRGYSLVYTFEEGVLESSAGSLWNQLCQLQPKSGEQLTLLRTGKTIVEMKWTVRRASNSDVPEIDTDEFDRAQATKPRFSAEEMRPDEDVPF